MTRKSVTAVIVALCLALGVASSQAGPPEADQPVLLGDGVMIESATGPHRIRMIPARLASPGNPPAPQGEVPTVLRDGKVWRKLAARPVIVSSAREALYGRNSAIWPPGPGHAKL